MDPDEKVPLSHGPLVWMVHEAIKAGLGFDQSKLLDLRCIEDESGDFKGLDLPENIPQVQVNTPGGSPTDMTGSTECAGQGTTQSTFRQTLKDAYTTSKIHDCLEFGGGLKAGSVLWWNMMEVCFSLSLSLTGAVGSSTVFSICRSAGWTFSPTTRGNRFHGRCPRVKYATFRRAHGSIARPSGGWRRGKTIGPGI